MTSLTSWLDAEPGRVGALAKHVGVTSSAVSQWQSNGVPLRHMSAVSEFTGGAVSTAELAAHAMAAAQERAQKPEASKLVA